MRFFHSVLTVSLMLFNGHVWASKTINFCSFCSFKHVLNLVPRKSMEDYMKLHRSPLKKFTKMCKQYVTIIRRKPDDENH